MGSLFEIADPSDWSRTELKDLASVETALRCQVCKDFYDTPMITSCSHTFCSLCIRRCLTNDGKCPTCRAPDQELRLRRNWTVEELVESFKRARPALISFDGELKALKVEAAQGRGKRKRIEPVHDLYEGAPDPQRRRTRSQNKEPASSVEPQQMETVDDSEEEPGDEEGQPDDGLIACPICSKRMKEEEVFPHLDVHNEPQTAPPSTNLPSRHLTSSSKPRPTPKPPERLPQLSYGLLKDQALRKKLSELGIPSAGPRGLMIKRHTEWVNLVNANADSSRPKSRRELLDELHRWERSEGRQINDALSGVDSNTVMRKDFDGKGWAATHGDSYQQLIASAKMKAKQAKREDSSAEDEKKKSDAVDDAMEETQDESHDGSNEDGPERQRYDQRLDSAAKDSPTISSPAQPRDEQRSPFSKDPIEPPSASTVDLTSQG